MIAFDVQPNHVTLVKTILNQLLLHKAKVWLFGSRATGSTKPHSDLDLAIDQDGQPLTLLQLAQLNEAFDNSALPYKVDVVDMNDISTGFLTIIQEQSTLFFEKTTKQG